MLSLLNPSPDTKRLLIVEDDEILMSILKNYANNFFDEIYTFESAESAKKFIESTTIEFDCSLIDFFLPGDNGDSLIEIINNKQNKNLFIMSGDLDRTMKSKEINIISGVIQKPISLEKIHKIFNSII